jgi:hypothetical protein
MGFKKGRIVQLVERWFPKPKARGSSPFFPVIFEQKVTYVSKQL